MKTPTDRASSPEAKSNAWQPQFEELLPSIQRRLSFEFRHLHGHDKQEAIQEGTVNCMVAFARLCEKGRRRAATASSLARYAARQVRAGRNVATPLNINDPLSVYARRRKGIKVHSFPSSSDGRGAWVGDFAEDRRVSVAEQAAFRIDVPMWLRGLSRRKRQIAKDLAVGSSASEVARKHRLTAGRISQIRRELLESWRKLHGEAAAVRAA